MERDDHDEILRLRDRIHDIDASIVAFRLLIDDLREWRAQARVQLEDLVKADDVAEAVTERMRKDRTLGLTFVQKACAFVVGGVVLADAVKGLLQ